jgi:Ca2+-transporting ATPase
LPPEEEVMSEKPRPRERFIITRPMALSILGYGSLFVVVLLGMMGWWHHTTGAPTLEQLTIFFSVFVFLQFWNLFNAKGFLARHLALFDHRDCRLFFAVLLLIGVGQVAIVEWGGEVFRTGPLSLSTWGRIIGFTSLVALGGELLRLLRREIPKKR